MSLYINNREVELYNISMFNSIEFGRYIKRVYTIERWVSGKSEDESMVNHVKDVLELYSNMETYILSRYIRK